jgi:circadian clock protein KaiC
MSSGVAGIKKIPSGVKGLDQLTNGGLPFGRTTLVCGGAGCGKTMFGIDFLVNGARQHDEPGVYLMFEENARELADNVRSMGLDLEELQNEGKLLLEHIWVDRNELEETGEFDLEGLFIRLEHAVKKVNARRVVLDTLDVLFQGFSNDAVLRAELRRLFRWLKDRGLTAVITAESGIGTLTRNGFEEYVADCVIFLDHRVKDQISTRLLRIIKYRGSSHGTNEYPFLISNEGLSVFPVTSFKLDHKASKERISTGVPKLDEMFGGKGIFRGSSTLITGTPGTGKSTLAAAFLEGACSRGERCVLFSYEESPDQVMRNMHSVGIDLEKWVKKGNLHIFSARPTLQGLEQHLVHMHDIISEYQPTVVAIDPISNFTLDREALDLKPMLMRLIDLLKGRNITGVFTSLTNGSAESLEDTQIGVSSLMDTWLLLRNLETNGERTRTLYILKSRGMSHSNQVREFIMSDTGIDLVDVYLGTGTVLTGTARVMQESADKAAEELKQQQHLHLIKRLENKRRTLEARIQALQAQAEADVAEMDLLLKRDQVRNDARLRDVQRLATMRDGTSGTDGNGVS